MVVSAMSEYLVMLNRNDGRPSCMVCDLPMRWQSVLICRACTQELVDAQLWAEIRDSYYPLKLVKH